MQSIQINAITFIQVLRTFDMAEGFTSHYYLYVRQSDYTVVVGRCWLPVISVTVPESQPVEIQDTIKIQISKELYKAVVSIPLESVWVFQLFKISPVFGEQSVCVFEGMELPQTLHAFYFTVDYSPRLLCKLVRNVDRISKSEFQNYLDISKRFNLEYSAYSGYFYSTDEYMYTVMACPSSRRIRLNTVYGFPGELGDITRFLDFLDGETTLLDIVEISSNELIIKSTIRIGFRELPVCLHYFNSTLILPRLSNIDTMFTKIKAYLDTEAVFYHSEQPKRIFDEACTLENDMVQIFFDDSMNVGVSLSQNEFNELKRICDEFTSTENSVTVLRTQGHPYTYLLMLDFYDCTLMTTMSNINYKDV